MSAIIKKLFLKNSIFCERIDKMILKLKWKVKGQSKTKLNNNTPGKQSLPDINIYFKATVIKTITLAQG